jgi:hypothetical protein
MPVRYSKQQSKTGASIGTIISVSKPDTWTDSTNLNTESSRWNIQNDYPGWLECDGRELSVNDYAILYSVLGNTYGGTAGLTFKLPDYRSKKLMGTGTVDSNSALSPSLTPNKGPGTGTIQQSIFEAGSEGGIYTIETVRQLPPSSEITPGVPGSPAVIGGDADDTFTIGTFRTAGFDTLTSEVVPNFSGNVNYSVGSSDTGTGTRIVGGTPLHFHTHVSVRVSPGQVSIGSPFYGRSSGIGQAVVSIYTPSIGTPISWNRLGSTLRSHSHMLSFGFSSTFQTRGNDNESGALVNAVLSGGNSSGSYISTSSNVGNVISKTLNIVEDLGVSLNPGNFIVPNNSRLPFDNALSVRLQAAEKITLMSPYFRLKYIIKAY